MNILVFDNEVNCDFALETINSRYECPFEDNNGYSMEVWSIKKKAYNLDKWYFHKPESRFNKTEEFLMSGINYDNELNSIPSEWIPPEM